ncbi:MAG: hypothetical protein AAGH65_00435 [Pseudomonadota bacterium]
MSIWLALYGCNLAHAQPGPDWSFEETFDGDPASPSQELLPQKFDYVVTHRQHPQEQFTRNYPAFPADHATDCTGPNPLISPLPQHLVVTRQDSDGQDPDDSFFICKNHMMSSMGEVAWYSNSAFWPRQAFDFSEGGVLEFDVSINLGHGQRSWWEILIAPREQMRVGTASPESAIDERYPADRIVLNFSELVRHIRVGSGAIDPDGWQVDERQFGPYDWTYWNALFPNDPALSDRRIRRTMRISLMDNEIIWAIETADGSFDEFAVTLPEGLPFTQGLVLFKTHAYTPVSSQNNTDTYTFHWDNIRFDGPYVGHYEAYPADNVVYLQANGNRPLEDTQTVTITLPDTGPNPVLFGQIHGLLRSQARLSINGLPEIEVNPYEFGPDNCVSGQWRDWKSVRLALDPDWLQVGDNTLTWRVGPRPNCAQNPDWWNGYSVKFLQIQLDLPNATDGLFADGFEVVGETSSKR